MKDDFLRKHRKRPDPTFSETLYRRLNSDRYQQPNVKQLRVGQPSVGQARIIERIITMITRRTQQITKPVLAGLAVALVVGVLFSFAPVRALAANFLSIFRTQELRVVRVSQDRLTNLENNEELSKLLEQFDPEREVVSGSEEPQEVDSLDEAARKVNFEVARLDQVPADVSQQTNITVHSGSVTRLTLDKALIEDIFAAGGVDLTLPDSVDDEPFTIHRSASIMQVWGDVDKNSLRDRDNDEALSPFLMFNQTASATIEHPEDLNLETLGIALLQFLGKSEEEARTIGQTIDWTNTLLLPIPDGKPVKEVSINGATGLLFSKEQVSGVMWQNNGKFYTITGAYADQQILEMAQSVK